MHHEASYETKMQNETWHMQKKLQYSMPWCKFKIKSSLRQYSLNIKKNYTKCAVWCSSAFIRSKKKSQIKLILLPAIEKKKLLVNKTYFKIKSKKKTALKTS